MCGDDEDSWPVGGEFDFAWEEATSARNLLMPSGAVRLTKHRRGFVGLWKSLKDKKDNTFPTDMLTDAKETLLNS